MGDCVIGAFISILESVAINFGTNHIIKMKGRIQPAVCVTCLPTT
ncbi:BnaUnng00930D [Brassica napus]|uniref:BnaUnng00930D protein n=1 Tax=Brassica napus TaxID=3708 RepID=A0A078JDJ8_BRANA|nr:BnaUnng00930D [Brassica napus]